MEAAVEPSENIRRNFVALTIATCGGVGYVPVVPASWGSLAACGIYFVALIANDNFVFWAQNQNLNAALIESFRTSFILVFLIGLFLIGMWAATRVVKITGVKDPRLIVIDEVVGQFITFLFVPAQVGWWIIPVGFFAFRLFDIWKLFPADKLEFLPDGLGVMADDVMAGFYAAALVSVVCAVYLAII
jgi:phosphatidylglycerophosphatase A